MKIERVNFALIDLSESENATVSLSNLPSSEELATKLKELLSTMREEGVAEISELNIAVLDLSESEAATVK